MNQQDQTFYNILLRIEGKLGGIENELQSHSNTHNEIKKLLDTKEETLVTHDERLKGLESFRTSIKAKVATVASIASFFVSIGFVAIKKIIDTLS